MFDNSQLVFHPSTLEEHNMLLPLVTAIHYQGYFNGGHVLPSTCVLWGEGP